MEEEIKEYTYCKRCNRKLKSEQARQLGFGSTCYKKYVLSHDKRIKLIKIK